MDLDAALDRRLATQRLVGPAYPSATDAVRHLLAVQAQDAPLARWSLAMRTGRPADATIREAVDSGAVIRTHVLRPTWHFVAAEDLRWLLDLTAPKVLRSMASRSRHLGLGEPAVVRREVDELLRMLADRGPLTRRQVVTAIGRDDLKGERLGQVIGIAELDGLVCSGPLADGQHTYALLDDRVAPAAPLDRDEAIRALVLRFLTGHGPASVAHLVRWATLTKREVQAAIADLADVLIEVDVGGRAALVRRRRTRTRLVRTDGAFLLPVFDEAYLTYPSSNFPRLPDHPWGTTHASFAEAGGGVVVHGRRDVGWWKRKDSARTTTVTLGLASSLDAHARSAIEAEAEALAPSPVGSCRW